MQNEYRASTNIIVNLRMLVEKKQYEIIKMHEIIVYWVVAVSKS